MVSTVAASTSVVAMNAATTAATAADAITAMMVPVAALGAAVVDSMDAIYMVGTPVATTQVFFVASRAMIITAVRQIHSVAAGGTSTMTITKDTGTDAPGAGTSIHASGTFNLNATANTSQSATLSATPATLTLAAGDRLSIKFAHAVQSSAGVVVSVALTPV